MKIKVSSDISDMIWDFIVNKILKYSQETCKSYDI